MDTQQRKQPVFYVVPLWCHKNRYIHPPRAVSRGPFTMKVYINLEIMHIIQSEQGSFTYEYFFSFFFFLSCLAFQSLETDPLNQGLHWSGKVYTEDVLPPHSSTRFYPKPVYFTFIVVLIHFHYFIQTLKWVFKVPLNETVTVWLNVRYGPFKVSIKKGTFHSRTDCRENEDTPDDRTDGKHVWTSFAEKTNTRSDKRHERHTRINTHLLAVKTDRGTGIKTGVW